MKRVAVFLMVCVLASILKLLPWERADVANLLPIETLVVDYENGRVILKAAEGNCGEGESLKAAMDDMTANAPGELFYGQVARIIVGPNADWVLQAAAKQSLLRLNVAVYQAVETEQLVETLEELEPRLRAQERRGALTTLLDYCVGEAAPQEVTV